jgi:hypothetical protein
MAQKQGAFPYDIDNLLGGAVRILYAPLTEPVPASIADVIDMTFPYAPGGTWVDVGATKESFTYTRGFETEGYEIQQEQGNVIEEITNLSRTIEVSVAEFRPEMLALIEGGGIESAVAAASGSSAQDRLGFGAFESLDRWRWAFISRRNKVSRAHARPVLHGRALPGPAFRRRRRHRAGQGRTDRLRRDVHRVPGRRGRPRRGLGRVVRRDGRHHRRVTRA